MEKKQLMDANLKKLAARHPAYFPRVHHFIARDPSATLRALMVARLAAFEGGVLRAVHGHHSDRLSATIHPDTASRAGQPASVANTS